MCRQRNDKCADKEMTNVQVTNGLKGFIAYHMGKHKMYNNFINRFLRFSLPSAILISGIAFYFYFSEIETIKQTYETQENVNIKIGKMAIAADLEFIATDLMVLAQHNAFHQMQDSLNQDAITLLEQDFLVFSQTKQLYDQVRFLDMDGMEIVRINFNAAQAFIVSKKHLQNKSKRYYFKDVIQLNKGEIFVSPFDLNIEHGQIEKPIKPMLRFGTPVFNEQGEKKGIILLNYLGSKLITSLKEATANHIMLLNADGFWLSHHHRSDLEWGFMFGNEHTFGNQFPKAWEKISQTKAGQFYDTDGRLFTFETVYPLREGEQSSTGATKAYEPSHGKINTKKYYWKLVAQIPNEIFNASANKITWNLSLIIAPLFILLISGSWWLASLQIQQQAERELNQLNKTNQAKNAFLAKMSHELRTPLNGILGFTQILKRDRTLNPQQVDDIRTIEQAGEHLLLLLNNILDMAKADGKKIELQLTEFHFDDFLKAIVNLIKIRAQQKSINFIDKFQSGLPIAVKGDKTRLRQIIVNLLINAIKFTEHGSVKFQVSRHQEKIRFWIEDTGIGIAPDKLETIFEAFSQVNYQNEGAGLGLSISKELVELMDSTLNVKSTLGKGSVFWFDLALPEVKGLVKSKPERTVIGFKGRSRKILVVDDNKIDRTMLVHLLLLLGFEVLEASNGLEGLEKALLEQPDMIFMNLIMPVMNGYEACRLIRQSAQQTVIIVLSTSIKHKEKSQDCDDFITKPVQLENELFHILTKHLKLEWIYDDIEPDPTIEQEPLIPPPTEELKVLHKLAILGNMRRIQESAKHIEQLDEKYIPFAKELSNLAKHFEDEKILALVEQYMEEEND
jgi:signal transduction histidine kinase